MTDEKYTALSLGWGVQSFTMLCMVIFGDLPKIDIAIHSDTTHERVDTYLFAEKQTPWVEKNGIKIVTVKSNDTKIINKYGGMMIPAYTTTPKGNGQMSRQCTYNWKRIPTRRYLQQNRNKKVVELWLGISLDEAFRMKDSDVKYICHRWPLIELKMKRQDCIQYLKDHSIDVPPKSSCVFCPYHDKKTWQELKKNSKDWQLAILADETIRQAKPPYNLYVHPKKKPLSEIDFRTEKEKGQISLWDDECEGYCGI